MKYLSAILCNEKTLALAALVGILVFASNADADWLTLKDGDKTVAILHGSIDEPDIELPDADVYHINSGGGQVYAGKKIAEALIKAGKPVTFDMAFSIAGYIALKTKAMPRGETPKLGFHWSWSHILTEEQMEPMNTLMAQTILEHVRIRKATSILAAMDELWGHDQSTSMVIWHLKSDRLETILDGKTQ